MPPDQLKKHIRTNLLMWSLVFGVGATVSTKVQRPFAYALREDANKLDTSCNSLVSRVMDGGTAYELQIIHWDQLGPFSFQGRIVPRDGKFLTYVGLGAKRIHVNDFTSELEQGLMRIVVPNTLTPMRRYKSLERAQLDDRIMHLWKCHEKRRAHA